jgi:hypothetical protein
VFTVAADVINPQGDIGRTSLVTAGDDGALTVELDGDHEAFLRQIDTRAVPSRVAAAFVPGGLAKTAGGPIVPLVDLKITDGMSLRVRTAGGAVASGDHRKASGR